MGLFWLFLVLGSIIIVLSISLYKFDSDDGLAGLFVVGLIFVFIGIVIGGESTDQERKKEYIETLERREELVDRIELVRFSSSPVNLRLYAELYEDCRSFDKKLEEHGRLYSSKWRGRLYSKEISEIEPIVSKLDSVFNERSVQNP